MQSHPHAFVALALLAALSLDASARKPATDQDLRAAQGKDGVTLVGDLQIKSEAFIYTDTDISGGSLSFNDISVKGLFVRRYDILSGRDTGLSTSANANVPGSFVHAVAQSMQSYLGESGPVTASSQTAQQLSLARLAGLYEQGDVVQVAFPNAGLASALTPTYKIDSITMGNSNNSFGSVTLDKVDFQGTKRWMWPH